MSADKPVYGQIELRQCADKRWRKGIGAEIVDAPRWIKLDPSVLGKRSSFPFIQIGPNEIVTIRGLGRTVAYRMERETQADRLSGERRAEKVYDDAEVRT